jgi:hypothetical protein
MSEMDVKHEKKGIPSCSIVQYEGIILSPAVLEFLEG